MKQRESIKTWIYAWEKLEFMVPEMESHGGGIVPSKGRDTWSTNLRIHIFRLLNRIGTGRPRICSLLDHRFLVCEGIRATLLNR
jgi:hypothetical protein